MDEAVYRKAVRSIFRRSGFTVDMMETREVRALVDEYARVLNTATRPALESGIIPEAMARKLEEDVFVFSGFKTYQGLKEASRLLRDDGTVKPFHRFYNDITAVKENYNRHWLKSEYVFAQASSEMAAKWKAFEADGDRYNLQYRTAHDGKVRPEHRVLHGTTLPPSDPFWDEFFPPNGWRCRCTVIQVRKGKYPESDSATAIQQGREATYQAGKNGVNRAEMFRFNPGKQQVVFPKHHPYYNVSQREREAVQAALRPEEKIYETRISEMVKQMQGNLNDVEKRAIAENNIALEKELKIANVKPMTYEEANEGKENPKFNENQSYQVNCQTCVPAHLLRRRGFNIEALPNIKNSAYQLMDEQKVVWYKNLFTNADGTDAPFVWAKSWAADNDIKRISVPQIKRFFVESMKEDGLYEVYCSWKKGSAHVFCAEVKEGSIRFFDPQSGKDHVDKYIDYMKGTSVGVLRIDNKLINPKVAGLFTKSQ